MENEASQFEDSSDKQIDEDAKIEDIISIDGDREKSIHEEKIRELELGMVFDSVGELFDYYVKYGNEKGFPVKRRSSKKGDDGEVRWVIFACSRSGKTESTPKKAFKWHHLTKTGCKAKINAALMPDGKWRVTSIVLDHNHELTPGKLRSQKKNRTMGPHVKQKLEVKDQATIVPKKNNDSDEHKNERFGRMCNAFLHQVVDLAASNEDKTRLVMQWIKQLSNELNKGEGLCGDNQPTSLPLSQLYTSSTSDDIDSMAKERGSNWSPSADHVILWRSLKPNTDIGFDFPFHVQNCCYSLSSISGTPHLVDIKDLKPKPCVPASLHVGFVFVGTALVRPYAARILVYSVRLK
ncbi:hypothetical protein FRX31_013678 [Thalictrum thalictroides]|uniref:FAR1 domain-containing protein n=1 Tax=Thalictrum thalictroides TaxID=46969 RepID=A0A7J6WJV7_THATH|nr:hypothetical protein FRX31_013678 [Thalictrum thalictroides]